MRKITNIALICKRYLFIYPLQIFTKGVCWSCGSSKTKQGYSDYLDGHTLLESETKCGNCDKTIVIWAYGGFDDPYYYMKTKWQKFLYLYFNIY